MEFTLADQLLSFAFSLACGVALGLFYELLRLLRVMLGSGKVLVFCLDILFMLVLSLVSVLFSVCFSRGNTRYFIVIGELLGILTIRFSLGRLSTRFFEPFLRKILRKCRKITVNMGKLAKKLLQVTFGILYNKFRKKDSSEIGRKSTKRGKRHYGVKTAEE